MTHPGSNLLRRAAHLIHFQQVDYFPFKSRSLNAARQWVSTFDPSFKLSASVQAVPRNSYADMGLNFNGQYVKIFSSLDIIDLRRDSSGDRFVWQGDWYQMESGKGWFAQDGWASALAVLVKAGSQEPDPE